MYISVPLSIDVQTPNKANKGGKTLVSPIILCQSNN